MSYEGPPQPTPGPIDPSRRPGLSAGMIVLIVVGLLFLTCVGGAALFMMSDAGKAVREATSSAMNAQNAPGTEELRELGCSPAMIMDMSALSRLMPEGEELPAEVAGSMRMVMCTSSELDCAAVAESYIASQQPEDAFTVLVADSSGEPSCNTVVSPDGQVLKDLAR